jgi:hypothetical protein
MANLQLGYDGPETPAGTAVGIRLISLRTPAGAVAFSGAAANIP